MPQVEQLFVELAGNQDNTLGEAKTREFFERVINLIAPGYSEEKRTTLLQGTYKPEIDCLVSYSL